MEQGGQWGVNTPTVAARGGRRGRPHEDLAPPSGNGALDSSQPNDHVVGGGMLRGSAKSRAQELWMLNCGGKYTLMMGGVRCLVQDGFAPPSTHHLGGDQPPPHPRRCSRSVGNDVLASECGVELIGYRRGEGVWGRSHRGGVELTIKGGLMNCSHTQYWSCSWPRDRVVSCQKSARAREGCLASSDNTSGENTRVPRARGRERARARVISRFVTRIALISSDTRRASPQSLDFLGLVHYGGS